MLERDEFLEREGASVQPEVFGGSPIMGRQVMQFDEEGNPIIDEDIVARPPPKAPPELTPFDIRQQEIRNQNIEARRRKKKVQDLFLYPFRTLSTLTGGSLPGVVQDKIKEGLSKGEKAAGGDSPSARALQPEGTTPGEARVRQQLSQQMSPEDQRAKEAFKQKLEQNRQMSPDDQRKEFVENSLGKPPGYFNEGGLSPREMKVRSLELEAALANPTNRRAAAEAAVAKFNREPGQIAPGGTIPSDPNEAAVTGGEGEWGGDPQDLRDLGFSEEEILEHQRQLGLHRISGAGGPFRFRPKEDVVEPEVASQPAGQVQFPPGSPFAATEEVAAPVEEAIEEAIEGVAEEEPRQEFGEIIEEEIADRGVDRNGRILPEDSRRRRGEEDERERVVREREGILRGRRGRRDEEPVEPEEDWTIDVMDKFRREHPSAGSTDASAGIPRPSFEDLAGAGEEALAEDPAAEEIVGAPADGGAALTEAMEEVVQGAQTPGERLVEAGGRDLFDEEPAGEAPAGGEPRMAFEDMAQADPAAAPPPQTTDEIIQRAMGGHRQFGDMEAPIRGPSADQLRLRAAEKDRLEARGAYAEGIRHRRRMADENLRNAPRFWFKRTGDPKIDAAMGAAMAQQFGSVLGEQVKGRTAREQIIGQQAQLDKGLKVKMIESLNQIISSPNTPYAQRQAAMRRRDALIDSLSDMGGADDAGGGGAGAGAGGLGGASGQTEQDARMQLEQEDPKLLASLEGLRAEYGIDKNKLTGINPGEIMEGISGLFGGDIQVDNSMQLAYTMERLAGMMQAGQINERNVASVGTWLKTNYDPNVLAWLGRDDPELYGNEWSEVQSFFADIMSGKVPAGFSRYVDMNHGPLWFGEG